MEKLSNKKFREVGKVYVYLQGEGFSFSSRPNQVLTGTFAYGRFGSAIAPLGDIDHDGFNGSEKKHSIEYFQKHLCIAH